MLKSTEGDYLSTAKKTNEKDKPSLCQICSHRKPWSEGALMLPAAAISKLSWQNSVHSEQ